VLAGSMLLDRCSKILKKIIEKIDEKIVKRFLGERGKVLWRQF
jgi:hypothetical protein